MDERIVRTEASCLSCLFGPAKRVLGIMDLIEPSDFADPKHVNLFRVITHVATSIPPDETVDFILVTDAATDMNVVRNCGGGDYILMLSDKYSVSENPVAYAQQIREFSRKRQIHNLVNELQALDSGDNVSVEDSKKNLRKLADLMEEDNPNITLKPISQIAETYMAQLNQVYEQGYPNPMLTFGYRNLDKLLGGIDKGNLVLIGSRPGMGKSSFGYNLVSNNTLFNPKFKSILFSMEMSDHEGFDRMVSSIAGVQTSIMRSRAPSPMEFELMENAANLIKTRMTIFDDRSRLTVNQLRAAVTAGRRRLGGLDVVIVDYIQLLSGSRKVASRYEEMSEVARALKTAAKDLEIPLIALAQLSRANAKENREPQLSDLRDAGELEAAADQVILLHNPTAGDHNRPDVEDVLFKVAKNRHSGTGAIHIPFDRRRATFISTVTDMPGD